MPGGENSMCKSLESCIGKAPSRWVVRRTYVWWGVVGMNLEGGLGPGQEEFDVSE